ncbi:MAG: formylmethanofuran dehydrogenase subunit C [Pseudomonadota bacterium]
MNTLILSLKSKPSFMLDMSPLIPEKVMGLNQAKIKQIKLVYGKETISVGSLFNVSGKAGENLMIEHSCDKLICVGKNMSSGHLSVDGDVGDLLGQSMTNGQIDIQGHAGSWVGTAMKGGRINISGNAGDFVGAGLPGDTFGMNRGIIYIAGNVGDRLGDQMRRGMIFVKGKAGDYCGSRMHAGTIVILDSIGKYPGNAMRRGTILLAKKPKHIAASFKSCGNLKMQFLRLFFTQLSQIDDEFNFLKKHGPLAHRFSGDLARNGKGELLILQAMERR